MTVRKFVRAELESEPHSVLFKDLYPWDAIAETPFGASLAIVQPGGRTMLHGHDPAETFVICRGTGTITIDGTSTPVSTGDVIYLHPQSIHDLRNDSDTDELVFVSVFWSAEATRRDETSTPRLIAPAPPTSNGPLHVGHLSGPYLMADVMRRYYRARGIPARVVCLMDEHQSYVLDRAQVEGSSAAETARRYSDQVVEVLAAFDAAPDDCIFPSRDAAYRAEIQRRFAKLATEGKLEAREVDTLACETCDLALYDSFVIGKCPHCGTDSYGFLCDACCFPNQSADLVDPVCDRCEKPAVKRTARRLVLPLAPYAEALADYHHQLRASPKLRRLATQWLERLTFVPASQASTWGIPVPLDGFDGQVISPWFEVALAGSHLHEQLAPGGQVLQLFGYDNAYLYLIHDPAVSLALGARASLPSALVANEFLMLDNAKMSTSRNHALDAKDVLARVPSDLLRLYLAKIRPEDARTSCSLAAGQMFLQMIAHYWQSWLARLGQDVAGDAGSRAPAPANPSLAPWSAEQTAFLGDLQALVKRAASGYDRCSLKEVSLVLHELVERAHGFGAAQSHLAGIPSLAGQRATGLALELAAARTLAMIVAPVMPKFAAELWACLGYAGPIEWIDEVDPIATGQPIATQVLAARAFFPERIELAV